MTARTFFAWILMSIGGLVALLAGGCSLVLASLILIDGPANGLWVVLTFGGVPFVVGLAFLWAGKALLPKESSE